MVSILYLELWYTRDGSRIFGQGFKFAEGGLDLTILPIFSKNSP